MEIVFYDIINGNPLQNVAATINLKQFVFYAKINKYLQLCMLENNKYIAVFGNGGIIIVFKISSKHISQVIKYNNICEQYESFQNGECLLIKHSRKSNISYSIEDGAIKNYSTTGFINHIYIKSYDSSSLLMVNQLFSNNIMYIDYETRKIIAISKVYYKDCVFRYSYQQDYLNRIFQQLSDVQRLKLIQLIKY